MDPFNSIDFSKLDNDDYRVEIAKKLYFYATQNDIWQLYRDFTYSFGVSTLLKIYDGKSLLSLIKENRVSIIIAVMLENNLNMVLDYMLHDEDFYKVFKDKIINYYSLIYKADYELLKKYLIKDADLVINYFSLDKEDYRKLFNDSDIDDYIICKLINKEYDNEFLSFFFMNDSRGMRIFNKLTKKTILSLIERKIRFSKEIIESKKMFNAIKGESIVNFRKYVNSLTFTNGYIDLEKIVYNYYVDLLSNYNPITKMFCQYDKLTDIKFGFDLKKDYILDNIVLYTIADKEELKNITSKKISEIVVDYLFKDDIYNVMINIREMLTYNQKLKNKLLGKETVSFYEMILNIDNISNDYKIKLFYRLKDSKVDKMFYFDLRKLKRRSYQDILSHLAKLHNFSKSKKLSDKFKTDVYDLRDKEFMLLVRTIGRGFDEVTTNRRDCYSIISSEHTEVFNRSDYVFGYDSFNINRILHLYEHDSFSSNIRNNETTFYINRLYSPNELIMATNYINEIQIINEKNGPYYKALSPSYIIAINDVRKKDVEESKRLGIPIILINEKSKKNGMHYQEDGLRIITDTYEESDSILTYTADSGISIYEEQRRNNNR